jgi:hypothetical protein
MTMPPENEDHDENAWAVDSDYRETPSPQERRQKNARFLELLSEVELWKGADGRGYATIELDGHREHWPIFSRGFGNWLRLRAQSRGDSVLGNTDVEKITVNLNARCMVLGTVYEVCHRVGRHGENIYLDLADDQWRAVEIVPAKADTAERWRVIKHPPVRFIRTAGMRQMPAPAPGGSIGDLRRWINVESEAHFRLTLVWLLACYRTRGPFPILILHGGQGSGKSTLARMLLRLTDPQIADMRSPPGEERDLWVAAQHARVLSYDNISSLSPAIADGLCRIATGGAFAGRTLYANDDETILQGCQPVLLNAIVDLARRADLADRALLIESKRLSGDHRRTEESIWAEFDKEYPILLGVLLDAVSAALGAYEETPVPPKLRMADAARWGEAVSAFFNWPPGEVAAMWRQNRAAGDLVVIESDIVGASLIAFLEGQGENWEGSTSDLHTRLTEAVSDKIRRSKKWPMSAHQLRSTLDRLRDPLETAGWAFARDKSHGKRRLIFTRIGPTGVQ